MYIIFNTFIVCIQRRLVDVIAWVAVKFGINTTSCIGNWTNFTR